MKENEFLKNTTIHGKILTNLKLHRFAVVVGKTFTNVTFERCKFNDVTFEKCNFRFSSFFECDLRNIIFEKCKFKDTSFRVVEGTIKLFNCYASHLQFYNCATSYSFFRRSNLRATTFILCRFRNANIESCNLNNSRFDLCDLMQAKFMKCNMKGNVFYSCNLRDCNFNNCNTKEMTFAPISRPVANMFTPFQTGFNACRIIPSPVRRQGFLPKIWRHELAIREDFSKKHLNFRHYNSIFKRLWDSKPPSRTGSQEPKKLESYALQNYLDILLSHQLDLDIY